MDSVGILAFVFLGFIALCIWLLYLLKKHLKKSDYKTSYDFKLSQKELPRPGSTTNRLCTSAEDYQTVLQQLKPLSGHEIEISKEKLLKKAFPRQRPTRNNLQNLTKILKFWQKNGAIKIIKQPGKTNIYSVCERGAL